ncbi:hypothetical protein [Dictyoglomus thermophilum]|uniref:Uncharacterized protein n=1 Tax=Dictyoglomus thermophilum (strain ATCC 35947 / DSM 3960 / H-6-12) TaxID=309799 RepID=B5YDL0_DICT6|nr:hypothetical protein [Dictyoglomus thermophilum]ACI18511.1 hypothetical protein DICTH_0751 [Dictyoglomus thermophilum H-6-12]
MYILNENSLSVEDFILILNSEQEIEISENLKNKVFLSSNLLKDYYEFLDKKINLEDYEEIDSTAFLSDKEVKGILLATIYTSANSSCGISYKVLEQLINLLRENIKIPEISLSTNLKVATPNYHFLKYLENITLLERKILLKTSAYIPGFICSYFEELQLIKKLLTISAILYFNYPYIDPYNLALTPYLPFIKLAENINSFSNPKKEDQTIDPLLYSALSLLYKTLDDLYEILNIQLNSSHYPYIFIPEKNNFIENSLVLTQKKYLLESLKTLLLIIDKIFKDLFIRIKFSEENKSKIYEIYNALRESDEPLLSFRKKIKDYKKALALILTNYTLTCSTEKPLDKILRSFMLEKNIKSYIELTPFLNDLLKTIEENINELY